jgi:hypothetical protein
MEVLEKVEKAVKQLQIVWLKVKICADNARNWSQKFWQIRYFTQDMSMTFKIMKNIDKIDKDKIFSQRKDERALTSVANPDHFDTDPDSR